LSSGEDPARPVSARVGDLRDDAVHVLPERRAPRLRYPVPELADSIPAAAGQ